MGIREIQTQFLYNYFEKFMKAEYKGGSRVGRKGIVLIFKVDKILKKIRFMGKSLWKV